MKVEKILSFSREFHTDLERKVQYDPDLKDHILDNIAAFLKLIARALYQTEKEIERNRYARLSNLLY